MLLIAIALLEITVVNIFAAGSPGAGRVSRMEIAAKPAVAGRSSCQGLNAKLS